jgi:signal recognition particle receptor subunit beta
MVLINKAINEVTVKLVYYGPGLCGKTTNLEKIYGNPKLENKGKMISMSTETDRTLFFDFMPMELGTIAGQKVRVQLYTVPGQVFYDATRKLVLRGADGVVFVADSQNSMRSSNIDSLENLKTNLRLNRLDPKKVAIVLQYNKRDLPNVDSVEELNAYLNPDGLPFVEAAARDGIGVTATLRAAVAKILDNVKNNVDTTLYEAPELHAPDMSAKSGVAQHSAGTPKLSMRSEPVAAPAAPAPPPMTAPSFESAFHATAVQEEEPEEDPFGAFAVVAEAEEEADDPFATPVAEIHDASAERDEMTALLASARAVVESLERALDAAKAHEREISARLAR